MRDVLESKTYHLEFEEFEKRNFKMFKGINKYDLVYFGDKNEKDEFWICSKHYLVGRYVFACRKMNSKNLKLPGYYEFTFDNEKIVERYFDEKSKLHSYDDYPGEILFKNGKPFRKIWYDHGVATRKEGLPYLIAIDENGNGFEYYGRSGKLNNTFGSSIKFYENGEIKDITIDSFMDDEQFFTRARDGIIQKIIQNQDVNVDSISGATFSSNGIKESVANALGISYTNTNSDVKQEGPGGNHKNRR